MMERHQRSGDGDVGAFGPAGDRGSDHERRGQVAIGRAVVLFRPKC